MRILRKLTYLNFALVHVNVKWTGRFQSGFSTKVDRAHKCHVQIAIIYNCNSHLQYNAMFP